MHDPSFMALALTVSEKMTLTQTRQNVDAATAGDDNDDAGKGIHMSHFSFAGETKTTEASLISWLVGCFGFNGPFRQYFSLYRAVS